MSYCTEVEMVLFFLHQITCVIQEVRHHSDVVHVCFRRSIQQHRTMYPSVVEEIKVDVLHKKPFRIPVEQ